MQWKGQPPARHDIKNNGEAETARGKRPAMTTPSRIAGIIEEMDQYPALANALRQRIAGQEFTEAIRSMQGSNTEILARQDRLGETVREAIRAVTGNVREMAAAAERMRSGAGLTELTELQAHGKRDDTIPL